MQFQKKKLLKRNIKFKYLVVYGPDYGIIDIRLNQDYNKI